MAIKSQIRRGTAAQWSAANTVLSNGEWGLETDTKKIKIGDGITPWSSLVYITDETYANAISYAISVANQAYTNSVNYVANGVANGSIVVANAVYAANAGLLGGSSLSTIQGQITGNASTAYANSVAYTNAVANAITNSVSNGTVVALNANTASYLANSTGTLSNIQSWVTGNSATAYTNAVSTSASDATTKSNAAYTNAVNYVANGVTNGAILAANATYAANAGLLGGSSLTTIQSQITSNAATAYSNAVTYANSAAGTAYTNAVATASADATTKAATAYTNATVFASNASNINTGTLAEARLPYRMSQNVASNSSVEFVNVYLTGNLTVGSNVNIIGANNYSITDNMIYLNANATYANPDIGFTAGYNDGTYAHTGFFRDHASGVWKVFDGYQPEPDASIYIDQSNSSFSTAGFMANVVYVGNNTVYGTVNSTAFSGTANNATNFGGLSLTTVQGQITGNAATAYSNAVNYVSNGVVNGAIVVANAVYASNSGLLGGSSLTTIQGQITGNAATAYSNSVAYTNITANAITNSVSNGALVAFTANNSNNLGGVPAASYVNTSGSYTITGVHTYNANLVVNGVFTVANSTSNVAVFAANGNVGVGTASPAYRLDTAGTTRSYGLISNQIGVPATPTGTANNTSGSLAAATYYFKIVAVGGMGNLSLPSAEANTTVTGGTSSIVINWAATPGASSYRIYYATAAGSQGAYYTSTTNTFTLTATSGTAGSPPSVDSTGQVLVGNTTTSVTVGGAIPLINLNPSSTNSISISAQSNTTLALAGSSTGQMLVLTDTTSNTLFMVANSSGATLLAARANNNIDLNPYVGNTTVGLYSNTPILAVGPGTSNSTVIIGGAAYNYINVYTTATTSVVLDTFNASTYSTVDYVIQAFANSNYQTSTLRVVANSTVVFSTEIGRVFTGANSIAEYTTTISGGVVSVNTIPVISGTTFKIIKTMIGA